MAKKQRGLSSKAIPRGLSVSLAGLRAGGALAVDSAMQKVMRRGEDADDSEFAKREARRFVRELGRLKGTYVKIGQMLSSFGEQILPPVLVEALHQRGWHFYTLYSDNDARLMCSWDTTPEDVDAFAVDLADLMANQKKLRANTRKR